MNQSASKKGKNNSKDTSTELRGRSPNLTQSLNMSTLVPKSAAAQYQNSLNATQDYSYPIGTNLQTIQAPASANSKNMRNTPAKLNDLRL